MRRVRLAAAVLTLSVLWLTQATPAAALLGWSQTGSPTSAVVGVPTAFTLRVSNDNLLSLLGVESIGCVRVDVGANFAIQAVSIVSAPGTWFGSQAGQVATAQSQGTGGRLGVGQSVTFSVIAIPLAAGASTWSTRVFRDVNCGGSDLGGTETLRIQVAPAPTVAPTPTPTATPTPAPTAPPTPAPTPTPEPTSVATPKAKPPTSSSTPKPTPTPILSADSPTLPPADTVPAVQPRPTARPATPSPTVPQSSASSSPTPGPTEAAATGDDAPPSPRRGRGSAPDTGGPPVDTDAAPRAARAGGAPLTMGEPEGSDAGLLSLGPLGVIDGITVWAIPGAIIGGPGLLVILWVMLQTGAAVAWIPAVRRMRGRDADRPLARSRPSRAAA